MSVKMGYLVQKELPAWVFDQLGGLGPGEAKQRRKADKKARKDAQRATADAAADHAAAGSAIPDADAAAAVSDGMAAAGGGGMIASPAGKDQGVNAAGGSSPGPLSPEHAGRSAAAVSAASAVAASAAERLVPAKPLWVAVAEAHAALPVLAQVGDSAHRTAAGTYVSGSLLSQLTRLKRPRLPDATPDARAAVPTPQCIRSVVWLTGDDDDENPGPGSCMEEGA